MIQYSQNDGIRNKKITFQSAVYDRTSCTEVALDVAIDAIRVPSQSTIDKIEHLRHIPDHNDRRAFKRKNLPCLVWSGMWLDTTKATKSPEHFSGIVQCDLDYLDDLDGTRDRIIKDPECLACFLSPSATGLKILYRYDPSVAFKSAVRAVKDLMRHYDLLTYVDNAVSNAKSLCYVSYDPEIYVNYEATCMPCSPVQTKTKKKSEKRKKKSKSGDDDNFEKYNLQATVDDVCEVLKRHGWKRLNEHHMARPGVDDHTSATVGLAGAPDAPPLFHVFSDSGEVHPFQADGTYNPTQVACLLDFSGDYAAFGRSLKNVEKKNVDPPVLPSIYYDNAGSYYLRSDAGFTQLTYGRVKSHLSEYFDQDQDDKNEIKDYIEQHIREAERSYVADYVGPYAARKIGVYPEDLKYHIVTSECHPPAPSDDRLENQIDQFCQKLLGTEQYQIFKTWLGTSVRNLQEFRSGGQYRPAPALILVGPVGCGKSLLLDIVVHTLGGRQSSVYDYLAGRTNFNGDFIASEILVADDVAASKSYTDRSELSQRIKNMLFASNTTISKKFQDNRSIRPWWRMIWATNDGPDDLATLPTLNDNMEDKILLMNCDHADPPYKDHELTKRWKKIKNAIPVWLHDVSKVAPDYNADARTGVPHWWHPDITVDMYDAAPEQEVLNLIRKNVIEFKDYPTQQLIDKLNQYSTDRYTSRYLGRLLSALARRPDTQLTCRIKDGKKLYTYQSHSE